MSHLFDCNLYNSNENSDLNYTAIAVTGNNNFTELVNAQSDYNYIENSKLSFIDCAFKNENEVGFIDPSFCENNNACEFVNNNNHHRNGDECALIKASDYRKFLNNNATMDYKYIQPQTNGNFTSQSVCGSDNFHIHISSAPQSDLTDMIGIDNEDRVTLPEFNDRENVIFTNNIKEINNFEDFCASSSSLEDIQCTSVDYDYAPNKKITNIGELSRLKAINFPIPNSNNDLTKVPSMIDISGRGEESFAGISHPNLSRYFEKDIKTCVLIKDFKIDSFSFEESKVPEGFNLMSNDIAELSWLNDYNALGVNGESFRLDGLNDSNAQCEKKYSTALLLDHSALNDSNVLGGNSKSIELPLKQSGLNNFNALSIRNESTDLLAHEVRLSINNSVKNTTKRMCHVCKFCNKQLYSHSGLKEHEAGHTCKNKYRCDQCDRSFLFFSRLKVHQKIHNEGNPCPLCDKKFNNKQRLIDHLNRHYGVRPFKCDLCDMAFVIKGALKEHKKIHTGENLKKFQCGFCQRFFKVKSYLEKHMRIHTNSKPFSCHHCQKAYNNKHDLSDHIKVKHARVKSEVCNICEKSFSRKIYLTQHYRTHTKEKPFACDICGGRFSQYSSMTAHKRLHTGERPEKCQLCVRTFSRKFSLKVHLKMYHKMGA